MASNSWFPSLRHLSARIAEVFHHTALCLLLSLVKASFWKPSEDERCLPLSTGDECQATPKVKVSGEDLIVCWECGNWPHAALLSPTVLSSALMTFYSPSVVLWYLTFNMVLAKSRQYSMSLCWTSFSNTMNYDVAISDPEAAFWQCQDNLRPFGGSTLGMEIYF